MRIAGEPQDRNWEPHCSKRSLSYYIRIAELDLSYLMS